MKHALLTGLSIGLLAIACTETPRMSTGNNNKNNNNQGSADSGQQNQNMDATSNSNPDATTPVDGGMMDPPDTGPEPDGGVDFTRDPSCPTSASWVTTVRGQVTDDQGSPLENAWAQICLITASGEAICLTPSDTIADGSFEVLIPREQRCLTEMVMRNLVTGRDLSTMYCHLPLDNAQSAYEVNQPLKLYPTVPATSLPDEGDREEARNVGFADGLEINLMPKYVGNRGDYAKLAAAPVDPNGLCFIDNPSAVDVLYAFSPEGAAWVDFSTNMVRPITVNIPVPSGTTASAGDKFDLYVLGGLGCPDPTTAMPGSNPIHEGTWLKFGAGTVNSGGDTIESDPGVGVPCLTWLKVEKQ